LDDIIRFFGKEKKKRFQIPPKAGRSMKYDELDLEVADKLADRKDVN